MKFQLKVNAVITGVALGLVLLSSNALADIGDLLNKVKSDFSKINEQGEKDRAKIRGDVKAENSVQTGDVVLAAQPEESQSKPTQLIVPKDKRVAAAMKEAMPTIKKVLAIHQCLKDYESLRQLNFYAAPGTDMSKQGSMMKVDNYYGFPNSTEWMKFHDTNKCVSLTTIDGWSMPALNALLFRAVYFADDSGETVNFLYLFKKVDDGSWKISKLEKNR